MKPPDLLLRRQLETSPTSFFFAVSWRHRRRRSSSHSVITAAPLLKLTQVEATHSGHQGSRCRSSCSALPARNRCYQSPSPPQISAMVVAKYHAAVDGVWL
nr:hypothetical protein Itr_chr06CG21100 [Ipomoea trifida]GMD59052.1 hypothetical protein Iba_chr11fCG11430 [Ipomoea batatas]